MKLWSRLSISFSSIKLFMMPSSVNFSSISSLGGCEDYYGPLVPLYDHWPLLDEVYMYLSFWSLIIRLKSFKTGTVALPHVLSVCDNYLNVFSFTYNESALTISEHFSMAAVATSSFTPSILMQL